MKITIEKRINKDGNKYNLRLVYWYGSHTDTNGKIKHSRKIEQLDQFLHAEPKTKAEKQHNKEISQLTEAIKAKRLVEAAAGQHGFVDSNKSNASFYKFFDQIMETKNTLSGRSNYSVWQGCRKQLTRYYPDENTTFEHITSEWLNGARIFFEQKAKTKSGNNISKATASAYFNKLRAVINAAYAKGIIIRNPLAQVKSIKPEQTKRTYLTIEEVRNLVKTECRYDVLKRAFLFSCLTGLRWSDINKLDWSQVSQLQGIHRIIFNQQKTGTLQYLDITEQAFNLMGEQENHGRVFNGLKYSSWMNVEIIRWCLEAGITKHVTFHSARHTFAVSLLCNSVDIYTVSKLLGHSEIKTTQIYADIIDSVRKDAMHKIPDIGLNF